MRVLLQAHVDTEKANEVVRSGKMPQVMQEIMERRFRWNIRQVIAACDETERAAAEEARPVRKASRERGFVDQRLGALRSFAAAVDEGIGMLFEALEKKGELDDTFIVFLGEDLLTRYMSRCSVRPSSTATMAVRSPREGERFRTNAVPVRVELTRGTLAPAGVDKLQPGRGHLKISLDRRVVTRTGSVVQVIRVPGGSHELEVEYVAADHLPFCPKVAGTRTIEVSA